MGYYVIVFQDGTWWADELPLDDVRELMKHPEVFCLFDVSDSWV